MGLLKTPTKFDGEATSGKKNPTSGNSGSLAQEIMSQYAPTMEKLGLMPTPRASNVMATINITTELADRNKGNLEEYIAKNFLPTPNASEGEKYTVTYKEGSQMGMALTPLMNEITGQVSQLNPLFVEEMMGFPPNWTELPFLNGETKV